MKTLIKVQTLIFMLLLASCDYKDDYETPSWDVSASAPIASSTIDFYELLGDSTLSLDTLSDNSLVFVYQQNLADYDFSEVINPASFSVSRTDNIGIVDIDDIALSKGFTFEEVIGDIVSDGTFIAQGTPPFNQSIFNIIDDLVLDYDASSNFQEILFADGVIELNILNEFPVDLTNISLLLSSVNGSGQSSLVDIVTIDELPAFQSVTEEVDMQGKFLSSSIEIVILNADLPAVQSDFTVDYQSEFVISMLIKDIEVQSANVKIPYKELVNQDTLVDFDFGNASLNRIRLNDGEIQMDITNNIHASIHFEYSIPGATLDGNPLFVSREIPASDNFSESISLVNYELDLSGDDGAQNNQLIVQTRAWVDSTSAPIDVSLSDELSSTISFSNIAPSVAWGFLGQDTIIENQEVEFIDLSLLNGDIDFEFVDVRLITENYVGAGAELLIQRLESFNDESSIELVSSLISEPFTLMAAQETQNPLNPVIPTSSEIIFNETNSNIDEIVESKPNKLAFDLEMILNGDNSLQNDGFIYMDQGVKSELQIEIPVSFNVSNLVLEDTVEVNLSVPEFIIDGSFSLVVDNTFPFEADVKLQLLNRANLVLQELHSTSIVQSSIVDDEGKTIQSTQSVLDYPFENLSVILNRTKKIALAITLNTPEDTDFAKLYSDYKIDVTIIGNFEKLISETITQ